MKGVEGEGRAPPPPPPPPLPSTTTTITTTIATITREDVASLLLPWSVGRLLGDRYDDECDGDGVAGGGTAAAPAADLAWEALSLCLETLDEDHGGGGFPSPTTLQFAVPGCAAAPPDARGPSCVVPPRLSGIGKGPLI